jgi:hypothetical protein
MSLSPLAKELELTDEELNSIPLDPEDLEENHGSSGDMLYNYYFYVPETTPPEILAKKTGRSVNVLMSLLMCLMSLINTNNRIFRVITSIPCK